MKKNIKVVTVVGTRPEVIRLSRVINYLDKNLNHIVIYESTVYPGLTEEICIPIIERESNKKHNSNRFKNSFYCGYSP